VLTPNGAHALAFGPEHNIPKPLDPRQIHDIAPAVAKAAKDTGVATPPIADHAAYPEKLSRFVLRSGMLMKPVFERAQRDPKRVAYGEGGSERVLQAAQQVVDEGLARPVLIGARAHIGRRLRQLGLRLVIGESVEVVDPADCGDAGTDTTALAFQLLKGGQVDAAIVGTDGRFSHHLDLLMRMIGKREGVLDLSTLNALVLPGGTVFLADTYVTPDPGAEELAELAMLSAATMRRMGVEPKVALLSHSNFGDRDSPSARKMRAAVALLRERAPDLEVDGEMHADAAMSAALRARVSARSTLTGVANLLVMPNIDAAHIAMNLLKSMGGGVSVGPIMLGAACPAHIVSQSITVRGLLNMTAVAVVDAQGEL
jgi:malate dehydrogenase (oxaloacetate-decarboxylating)(NADP+)